MKSGEKSSVLCNFGLEKRIICLSPFLSCLLHDSGKNERTRCSLEKVCHNTAKQMLKLATLNTYNLKENIMKSLSTKILVLCISSFLAFAFIGCNNEGPAEKAGKQFDQAVDSAKDKVEEATE